MKHQGLEDLLYVLTQTGGYVDGAEVVLVYFVWNKLIGYPGFIKQTGYVGFSYFSFIAGMPVNFPILLL